MKLSLTYYGNPVLRKKAAPISAITDEIKQLAADMKETMIAHNGWGIAAPQIGKSLSLFVMKIPMENEDEDENEEAEEFRVFINPKILSYSEEEWDRDEGCLSIPGLFGIVNRPVHIKVEALDLEGKTFVEEFSGLAGRIIMHENDHLNGVLFIDRIRGKERKEMESQLRAIKKKFAGK
jgi:peptide deformylase